MGRVSAGVVASIVLCGCFNPQGVDSVGESAATTGATTAGTTDAATTADTGPAAPAYTFRLDALELVEPHLFLPGMACTDATGLLNLSLQSDIDNGNMNTLMQIDGFESPGELRLIDGVCTSGSLNSPWTCAPKPGLPSIALQRAYVAEGACGRPAPEVLSQDNPLVLHDPQPPCLRTAAAKFSFPVGELGSILVRESQVVGELDSPAAPLRIEDGLVYGFLPRQVAEGLIVDVPLDMIDLWSSIVAEGCAPMFPGLLPSVDLLMVDGEVVEGVWLVFNFTASRVDFAAP